MPYLVPGPNRGVYFQGCHRSQPRYYNAGRHLDDPSNLIRTDSNKPTKTWHSKSHESRWPKAQAQYGKLMGAFPRDPIGRAVARKVHTGDCSPGGTNVAPEPSRCLNGLGTKEKPGPGRKGTPRACLQIFPSTDSRRPGEATLTGNFTERIVPSWLIGPRDGF